jgi:hypothetical protein
MIWEGHVARMGEVRNSYRILIGKPERKKPSRRSGLRREDNISRDHWSVLVNRVINLWVP